MENEQIIYYSCLETSVSEQLPIDIIENPV